MTSTHLSYYIKAMRSAVYRALLDPCMVGVWRVPDGMTSKIHIFEAREGGEIRVSLTYEDPTRSGKTTSHTSSARETPSFRGRRLAFSFTSGRIASKRPDISTARSFLCSIT